MPILSASKKALRVSRKKTSQNAKTKSKLYRVTKKVIKLIAIGEKTLAEQQLSEAYKAIDKAAKKGLIHSNKSAHLKSKLAEAVHAQQSSSTTVPTVSKAVTKRSKKTAANVKASPKNS